MNRKTSHPSFIALPLAVLLAALLACGPFVAAPTATEVSGQNPIPTSGEVQPLVATDTTQPAAVEVPTNTNTPITHLMTPGEPPAGMLSEITDRDSSEYAPEHRTIGGENFSVNFFERPFNANTMDVYFPDLDITRTKLSRDDNWVFVNIKLVGPNPAGGFLGVYGAEIDLNVDGRGDVLVMASKPGTAWSTDGVRAWLDGNHDVGGPTPVQSDTPPVSSDGYENLVFDQGVGADPDTAWSRVSPADPNSVQIAFKRALINDDDIFTWGAWTMNESMLHPEWFDYNDHFTAAEAGSPLTESQYYPLKALAELDNTCRWGVGFTPTGSEPGVCPVPPTPTPELPGTISGKVFNNPPNGGEALGPSSMPIPGVTVKARSGGCGSPGSVVASAVTNASGNYSMSIAAGTYCVAPDPAPYGYGGTPRTVTVPNAGAVTDVNFGYWQKLN